MERDFSYPALSQPVFELQTPPARNQLFWQIPNPPLSQPDNPPPPPSRFSETKSLTKLAEGLKSGLGEVKFVDPFKEIQTECPICLQILQEPFMVECCGYRFCEPCVHRIKEAGSKCPLCNQFFSISMPDKQLRRTLNERNIFCVLQSHGCRWEGERHKIQDHINVLNRPPNNSSYCQYVPVPCKFCNVLYRRINMDTHEEECPLKSVLCEHCKTYTAPYNEVVIHYDTCPCYPILCPNKCLDVHMNREYVQMHLKTDCPLQDIPCDFHYTGCNIVKHRRDMPSHLKNTMEFHLQLLAEKYQEIDVRCHELEVENQDLKILHQDMRGKHDDVKFQLTKVQHQAFQLETESEDVSCIYVTNLPDGASDGNLRSIFGQDGSVTQVKLLPYKNAAIVCYKYPHQYTVAYNRSENSGINLLKHRLRLKLIFSELPTQL